MGIIIIDKNNYINYADVMQDVFEDTSVIFNKLNETDYFSTSIDKKEMDEINNLIEVYYRKFGFFEVDILLLHGEFTNTILKETNIFACTVFSEGKPCCIIAWQGEQELLCRVMLHELCHAKRLIYMGMNSEGEYVKYLAVTFNQILEEMLAISTEKRYFPQLSWEEIIDIENHDEYIFYAQDICKHPIKTLYDLEDYIYRHQKSNEAIYFMAYYLSKRFQFDMYLEKFMFSKKSISVFDFLL